MDENLKASVSFMAAHLYEDERTIALGNWQAGESGFDLARYLMHFTNAVRHGFPPCGDPVGGWLACNSSFYSLLMWLFVAFGVVASGWLYILAGFSFCLMFNSVCGLWVHNRSGFCISFFLAVFGGPFFGWSAANFKLGLWMHRHPPKPRP